MWSRTQRLKYLYFGIGLFAMIASTYSAIRQSISVPYLPSDKLTLALKSVNSVPLINFKKKTLGINSSDRKASDLYHFNYKDGSRILALMVRVAKRDEFKIETYGNLTKNIPGIYIRNPIMIERIPFSIKGKIDGRESLQTCIIPRSLNLDQVDVRLTPLISTVERISPNKRTILSKVLGTYQPYDYSCLIMTFQPSASMKQDILLGVWTSVIKNVQASLKN